MKKRKKKTPPEDLDYLLNVIQVQQIDNDFGDLRGRALKNWWAVSNEKGVIAYFGDEGMACFFRLALVNARLNPMS